MGEIEISKNVTDIQTLHHYIYVVIIIVIIIIPQLDLSTLPLRLQVLHCRGIM